MAANRPAKDLVSTLFTAPHASGWRSPTKATCLAALEFALAVRMRVFNRL